MNIKNLAAATTLAVAALASPFAHAAADGDILEILPVDESGAAAAEPTAPLDGGEVARFAVRLIKPTRDGNQFRLVHTGVSSEAVDWVVNRPAIGIYVNGVFTLAYLEKVNARTDSHTDFIFSYTVKPGDFALPIRLAAEDGSVVTDSSSEPSLRYYLNFNDASLGSPAWVVDDSTDSAAATREAKFVYASRTWPNWSSSPDYTARRVDYDLSRCNFRVQTVDFDAEPESTEFWRSVHRHDTIAQPVGKTPSLVVSGMPTNSVTLYVWSENPDDVVLIAGGDVESVTTRAVHTTATTTEARQVGAVKIIAGKQEYKIALRGVAATNDATIVLSAFPDFHYDSLNVRLEDEYLTRVVRCVGPLPASVTIAPADDMVTATSDYTTHVTELGVALSENPVDHDFEAEIVPTFSDATCPNKWWDYIRIYARKDADATLSTPAGNPKLVFKAGETVPSTLKIPLSTGSTETMTISDGKLYVYAIRSDAYVTGANKINFAVTTTDATAVKSSADGGIDGWGSVQSALTVNGANPAIVSMFDGTDFATAVAGYSRTLQIVVSDIYADMHCGTNKGYQIWIERNTDSDTTFTQLPGLYYPGKGNVLFMTNTVDTLPTVVYTEPVTNKSVVYVVSPVSGNTSANHNFQVAVSAPAGYTVETTTGEEEFREGDIVQVRIKLDKQNTAGDMWAYIRGESDEAMAAIDATWKAEAGGKGRRLANYSGDLVNGCKFTLLDGVETGSDFSYEVVFLNQSTWTTNAGARVTAYQQKNTLALTVFNVVPSVKQVNVGSSGVVSANGGDVVVRGTTTPAKFPMGVTNDISVSVTELGLIDKTGTNEPFQVQWTFVDEAGTPYHPATNGVEVADDIVRGNPDTTRCQFDFPSEGRWTVTVGLKDKDMTEFGNGAAGEMFTFYVNVIDQPTIVVNADASYSEQTCVDFGGDAQIEVALQLNNCTFDMWVNLVVEPNKTGGTGTFLLQESDDVVRQPDGSYNVRIPRRSTSQTVFVQTMDGTADSRTTGFKITPTMVKDMAHVVPNSGGKRPHEYYLGVVKSKVLVMNDDPLLDEEYDVYPVPGTNAIPASIGAADETITWSFNDVDLDFERGITVEFKGGGGWGPNTYTNREEAMAAGAVGFTPSFRSSGSQSVKLTVKDPDGGTATVTWLFEVEAAKSMTIVAHGPASGDVSKYDSAAGLGLGRVWATSRSAIVADWFTSTINCGLDTSWRVYGYGYKVGDEDDGATLHMPDGFGGYTLGYYPTRDTPLNARGANRGAGESAYAYVAPSDMRGNPVDSFLYTWMLKANESRGGGGSGSGSAAFGYLNNQTAPEYLMVRDSGKTVSLPTEQNEDGGYVTTVLEAIFSVEYLATDNMGDINGDGIPDVYVNKYGFGIVDPETGEISSGSDLANLNAQDRRNPDEDYLPASRTTVYGTLIPDLPGTWLTEGTPFTSKLEIRGNGDSLNDAPANNTLTRVANVLPDRVYTDPRTDAKSTLDGYDGALPVEYLAWLDYAAANGLDAADTNNWSRWSPERPTDPTVADTDGDDFPDGYEYFIWYRAHVGYGDGGVHKYLTGRKYDPKNPGEGTFISSAEIAAAYDPVVANAAFSVDLDTDNDGLPDLVEFALGTSPFDFDTDGDGLPDGFEILIAGTDPLETHTVLGMHDAMRNYDGDAMAYTSADYEENYMTPAPKHVKSMGSFALVDADGDVTLQESAFVNGGVQRRVGVQWYVMPTGEIPTNIEYTADAYGYTVKAGGVSYVTTVKPAFVTRDGTVRLSADLSPETTWTLGSFDVGSGTNKVSRPVRLMPTRLVVGTVLDAAPDTSTTNEFGYVSFAEPPVDSMSAWVYGRSITATTTGELLANLGGFGFLVPGRYKDAPVGVPLAALPQEDKTIAFIHHLVYQEFGFDPRTAWNANTPLGARWGRTTDVEEDGETATEAKANNINAFGYVGVAARTREYTLYDEFLLLSFYLNGLSEGDTMAVHPSRANPWHSIWSRYTTNGRGPGEAALAKETDHYTGRTLINGSPDENGADTDGDGVPDGWELYVTTGPKRFDARTLKYYFRFPAPYDSGYMSAFGPFVPEAKNASSTDNNATGGYETTGGDGDGLNEYQEFAGTDTTLYYADFSTTITRPEEHAKWLNKFFPTDPWTADTDGDGVGDNQEKGTFIYGEPADDGKLVTIPGGGLNPLSVDTDFDGLPDGWERQFKGKNLYSGADATYAKVEGSPVGNPLEGLVDGMDGTVPDALNVVHGPGESATETLTATLTRADGSKMFGKVNRDYDRDGLENWQEYLVGTMRCWRYDDILTPWNGMPAAAYWNENGDFAPNYDVINAVFGSDTIDTTAADGGDGEFWYKTLVDRTSPIYNPRFVSDQTTSAQYFSRVTNVWDVAYIDDAAGGARYYFKDRIDEASLKDLWAVPFAMATGKSGRSVPGKYISCSPIDHDTDHDGLDDYYELFHGMNPLLGGSGVPMNSNDPCDVVFDAWYAEGVGGLFEAWNTDKPDIANYWTLMAFNGVYYKTGKAPRGTGYDFEYFPWLNGLATADPDGDDVRNQVEGVMPRLATSTWLHTDPTPLWMTDSEYDYSLTRLFFRMPGRDSYVPTPGDSFEYKGQTYYFTDFGGWAPMVPMVLPPRFVEFSQDLWWSLYGVGAKNWIASFEENEGYDSDHDAMSDRDEASGKLRAASDPQDANSPNRRQAMYFQGPEKPSALQTPPEVAELYPVAKIGYPDEPTFMQFTVECWAKAESLADATLVERAIWSDPSKAGDEELVRKNFQLGIKNKKWYAKFDTNGTLARSAVEVLSEADAETGVWHHVAAALDGGRFILYIDGQEAAVPVETSSQPEYGSSALAIRRGVDASLIDSNSDNLSGSMPGDYWSDAEYALRTVVVGASLRTVAEGGSQDAFEVGKAAGWEYYSRFFKGYIDEVRIWDGARSSDDIRSDCSAKKRYTRETAIENRSSFYRDFASYGNRYRKDDSGDDVSLVPELVYHFSFDSVPGGADEAVVAKVPSGFDYYQQAALGNPERGAAVLSRPTDWTAAWWAKVVSAYGSVYSSDQWIQWIPNTVAHLPRFDGTTLDSFFWSENSCGATNGTFNFARTAEPASRWKQLVYNGVFRKTEYVSPGMRHHLLGEWHDATDGTTNSLHAANLRYGEFLFTGRHALQEGMDLLPLGGAYAKSDESMWDAQGASTSWELTANDVNYNGLPDIWEEFAVANYSPESEPVNMDTMVYWKRNLASPEPGIRMTAREAFRRDLAHGRVVATNEDGDLDIVERDGLAQTADEDSSRTPDWWDDMYGVYGLGGTTDSDNDGLSNYIEYLASECFPFGMMLNPKMPKSDAKTPDYFRKVGKLHVGEMFTDHDQMEDHWERARKADTIDVNVWDAQRDGDEDGWTNFAENRYNEHCQSTLAELISHAVGDTTALDAPKPALKLTVRYNGGRDLSKTAGDSSGSGSASTGSAAPTLRVLTYTDQGMMKPDAEFSAKPGETVTREFYMGGWEDRLVRGTLDPGYVEYGDVDLLYAQLPQDDMYSWVDAGGTLHISRPYSEFKAALEKDPDIIQNIKSFEWQHLVPASYDSPIGAATSEKAVTVTSGGYIAVYGVRVGKIDLVTGDFEFDMAALANLTGLSGFYTDSLANAWGIKEAIFKLEYKAKVPDTQFYRVTVSLAEPEKGFVKGGKNSIFAYWDVGSDGAYTPGTDPCGVIRDVEIGWRGRELDLELSEMSAISPRVNLWQGGESGSASGGSASSGGSSGDSEAASDRMARLGVADELPEFNWSPKAGVTNNVNVKTVPTAESVRVRVMRMSVDGYSVDDLGNEFKVVLDRMFTREMRGFLHEGDFLGDGELDIDWDSLESEVFAGRPTWISVTNVGYAVVFGDGALRSPTAPEETISAHPVLVTRRFERTHTAPTAVAFNGADVCRVAQPTFSWRIDNEDRWASAFGTTYTAFRVKVWNAAGQEVYDSGYQRMPAADSAGVYSWTAPLYVDCPSPSGSHIVFRNLENYTWRVYTYNSKFKTDDVGSAAQTFRMNVTDVDQSSYGTEVKVCYAGPAANRAGRIRVQAFESPDFTGNPVAESLVTNVTEAALAGSAGSPVRISGLKAGTYYLRAYIDTDYDWTLDDWESWGYLNARDVAAVTGTKAIFNPVSVTVGPEVIGEEPRTIFIEDCDTDGDGFPDVWEAEQNGNVFDPSLVTPATGDAELIAVNTNLTKTLTKADQGFAAPLVNLLSSKYGVSMLTGVSVSRVTKTTSGALLVEDEVVDGTVAITSMTVDVGSGEVVLGVGAETAAGAVDPTVAALYSVERGATVTVKVYRTETLAGEWQLVAEKALTITSDGTEIRAPLPEGVDTKSGFFRVEVEQGKK